MTATSGADRPTPREQIADVLATHVIVSLSGVVVRCSCGWDSTSRIIDGLARVSENRAHLADALLPVVERAKAEAAAEALEEAADELDTRAVELWSAYKGAPPTDPRRASPHTEGESDGWENAGTHVRNLAVALRSQGGGR